MKTCLTVKEEIVVKKAIAAGMLDDIPRDDMEKTKALLKLGLLAVETFAYVDKHGAMRVGKVASENIERLADVKTATLEKMGASPLPGLSQTEYPSSSLEDWHTYAEQGPDTCSLAELNKTTSSRKTALTKEQIEIFFRHRHDPRPEDPATSKQKAYISSLVLTGETARQTQDEWTRMTKKQASSMISEAKKGKTCHTPK